MELNKKNIKTLFWLIAFGVILNAALRNIKGMLIFLSTIFRIIAPVTIGLCIAFVLNVLLNVIENKLLKKMKSSENKYANKLCRPLSIVLSLLFTFGIIILVMGVVIPELARTFTTLSESIPQYANIVVSWINTTAQKYNLPINLQLNSNLDWENIFSSISKYLTSGIMVVTDVTSQVLSGISTIFFGLIIAIYILLQKEKIAKFVTKMINKFLPERIAENIFKVASVSYTSFSRFISGQLLEACILGSLCFIGMTIFKFPYTGVVSIFIGVTSLVPIMGSFVGGFLGAFLILMINPIQALLFIIFLLILQQVEGNLIYPKVVGKSVGLPGILVLCSVILGGNIGGVFGALMGVPICSVIYTLIKEAINK